MCVLGAKFYTDSVFNSQHKAKRQAERFGYTLEEVEEEEAETLWVHTPCLLGDQPLMIESAHVSYLYKHGHMGSPGFPCKITP